MQDLTPGQSIAQRFKLTRRLEPEPGCECWLAEDETRAAPAVLRFPHGQTVSALAPEARREFERISLVVHPGIVPCLGLFQHADRVACAHAGSGNGDLRVWSGRDYREVLAALLPLMDALAHLHDLGIAHGRLDVRAIRVSDDGRALLDGTGAAVIAAGHGELPGIREDIRAFGKLLSDLAGIEGGTPVPAALGALFTAMQSADEDPPDIHAARRQIARALQLDDEQGPRALPVEGASAGPVTLQARSAPLDRATAKPATSRRSVPMVVAAPALLFVLALALLVIFYLPRPAPQVESQLSDAAQNTTVARGSASKAPAEAIVAPFAAAATAKVRQDAQDAAMSLLRSLVALEERRADVWAADEFAAARLAGEEGDAIYRSQEFGAALERYRAGLSLAEALVARSGEVLSAALQAGAAALQAGNADEARRQFELAAMIDGENPEAQSGLQRSTALSEVMSLLAAGAEREQSGRLEQARDNYRRATEIDPQLVSAAEALARVNGKLASQRYQEAMSRGFARLNQDDLGGARVAFEQAAKMRPDAAGPRDALAQLGLRSRNSEIAERRAAAAKAESEEQWRRAEAEYKTALDADSTLVFARDGLARAQQRALLDERMSLLIDEPLRMFSNDVYNEARAMLAQARLISDPGPRLQEQLAALAERIESARQPVPVQLRSDGQTTVTIFKVGELGRFQARTVGLIPGRYTAVGARSGYRDVRREFVVQAGAASTELTIVCEDPV